MNDVSLADAIKQLRSQLEEAQQDGEGRSLRFLARQVEVELAIVFKREGEGSAGVKAWVLNASAKAKAASEASQKVKVVLEPVGRDGKMTLIGDSEHEKE